jgi:hypothetical protein
MSNVKLHGGALSEQGPVPDAPLTKAQRELVESLSEAEIRAIDEALLANVTDQWRKVARVVGVTMMSLPDRIAGIPDVFYSQRLRKLTEEGRLESQGDLALMRYSEIRLPRAPE